jgi:uncharacterized protein YjgD (DUF1641 family)
MQDKHDYTTFVYRKKNTKHYSLQHQIALPHVQSLALSQHQLIQEYMDEIVLENLAKEVEPLLAEKVDENNNKLYNLWLEKKTTMRVLANC